MRRMITQKMIDYIKSIQVKAFSPEDVEYLKALEEVIDYDEEDGISFSPKVSFEDDVDIAGDLEVSGKINVGTPNLSGEFELINELPEGLALDDNSYLAFKVYGNVAYVVLEFGVVNSTGSAISTGNIGLQVKDLPDAIAEKIIRRDGTTLKTGQDTNATIANTIGVVGTSAHICAIQSYVAGRISCNVNPTSISANSTSWYSFRFIITL